MDSYGVLQISEYLVSLPGLVFFGVWFGLTFLFWINMDKSKTFRLYGFIISTSFIALVASLFGIWPITAW